MKQCGNCWGLLSTLGLTGFFYPPLLYRTIGIEMKQCGNCWGLLSTLGLTGRVGGASGGGERTGTLISQAVVQRGCRQLKTRPHCQGIQRKALGIWLASAPLSRQPY